MFSIFCRKMSSEPQRWQTLGILIYLRYPRFDVARNRTQGFLARIFGKRAVAVRRSNTIHACRLFLQEQCSDNYHAGRARL